MPEIFILMQSAKQLYRLALASCKDGFPVLLEKAGMFGTNMKAFMLPQIKNTEDADANSSSFGLMAHGLKRGWKRMMCYEKN